MPNIILALLKKPWRKKRLLLVDGIGKVRPTITNKILVLFKALWRKRFMVDEIVRGLFSNTHHDPALLKTPSVEGAHTIKVPALLSTTHGIQVRSSDINDIFGQYADLNTKTFMVIRRC